MSLKLFAPGSRFYLVDLDVGECRSRPATPTRNEPLPLDLAGKIARSALLDEETFHLTVRHVAGPNDDNVGDRAVADPLLRRR